MPETVENCLLCNSNQSRPFDRRQFRGHPVTNRLCANCGLVYQSPRMTPAEMEAFYEAEYRDLYQGGEGPAEKDLVQQRGRVKSLLAFAQRRVNEVNRHLDIGCSAGILLQGFQGAYDSSPAGVEPGDAYRAYAQASGLTVYASLEELKEGQTERFDLVSMAHVLEHIGDPVAYLADLRESLLAQDGWLLLEVPNLYAHDSFEVAHNVSFSAHTLTQTLAQAGFETAAMKKHGQPRSQLLPLYLTALARPLSDPKPVPVRPERSVALKRKLGFLRRRILTRLAPRRAWIKPS